MNKPTLKATLSALSLAMLLTACNKNDHDSPMTKAAGGNKPPVLKSLTVTPSLGKILKARVILRNARTGASLGEQNTGTTGKVTFNVPASVTAVVAEVHGGTGTTYFDEATRQMADMPTNTVIRAAATLVNNNSEIGVTALTEAAVQRAEELAGSATDITPFVSQANQAVAQAFGVANILAAPALVGSVAEMAALGTSPAEQYALRLSSLANVARKQLGSGEAAPALKMAQALAQDFQDGDIDGSGNTGVLPYDLVSFAAEYQAQLLMLVEDFLANASQGGFDMAKLQALLAFVQSHPLVLDINPTTIPLTVTGTTTDAGTVGTMVMISGTGFAADKTHMMVKFSNNVTAEIVSSSPTQVVVKVPAGAVTGPLTVTNTLTNLTASTTTNFTVKPDGNTTLAVTRVFPEVAKVGSTVVLTGIGFDADKFHMVVKFIDNVAAEVVSSSLTQLVVKVPVGAASGPITVMNGVTGAIAITPVRFTVQPSDTGNGNGWTAGVLPTSFVVNSIAFGAGKFAVVGFGKGILTSTDGTSWTTVMEANPNLAELKSIIHDGSQFVAVGGTQFNNPAPPAILTSPDGVVWTTRTWTVDSNSPEFQLTDVTASGGRLTAVGANGTIITSTDGGQNWSHESQPNDNTTHVAQFFGITANNNVRVAVGRNSASHGGILKNDGSGWVAVASDMADFSPYDVVWTGSQFVAVGADSANFGAGAVVMTSPDGTTWTRHAVTNAPTGNSFRSVFWDGTTLYAGGSNGQSSRLLMSSADGVTWTLEHQSTVAGQGNIAGIAGSSTRLVGVGGVLSVTKSVLQAE